MESSERGSLRDRGMRLPIDVSRNGTRSQDRNGSHSRRWAVRSACDFAGLLGLQPIDGRINRRVFPCHVPLAYRSGFGLARVQDMS
jgi:hypothetical protein